MLTPDSALLLGSLPVGASKVRDIVIKRTRTLGNRPRKNNMSPTSSSVPADRSTVMSPSEPDYLKAQSEADIDRTTGWLGSVESLIERYPWPTLLLALSLGYMISRRMR